MAISNFLPTVWSTTLLEALNSRFVGVNNCNRDFEGEIKELGNKVKICGIGSVNVFEYTKNIDMSLPQTLNDSIMELSINRARAFNFQIDDIDRAQANPKIMQAAMRVAASALAEEADSYVYSLYQQAANKIANDDTTPENILDTIIEAKEILYNNNVNDTDEVSFEVSPKIASILLKAKLNLANDTSDAALNNGYLGKIAGCKIYVSKNILKSTSNNVSYHNCYMRTKRAITFASQISEVNAYRPESRFADAVKGLHLYGAKIIYPAELVVLQLGIPTGTTT